MQIPQWLKDGWSAFTGWTAKNPGFYIGVAAGFVIAKIL